MAKSKICLPVNKGKVNKQGVIKLDEQAMATISMVAAKTGMSVKKAASMIITQAVENDLIEFKED